MFKRDDMRRKRRQLKQYKEEKEIVKDIEIIAFIDVLIDLVLCQQYRDCINERTIALF